MRITPAALTRAPDGTPFSPAYGDVYHSAYGGLAQARHVFLSGNGLPQRWSHRSSFTVLETGFGLGLNFLATCQAWHDDPGRCERLHVVALEKHPLDRAALAEAHAAHSGLAAYAARLQAAWPELVAGMHRLHFEGGRVTLTLAFGDVADVLPQLRGAVDAFFLDGFAPDRNPEMWTPAVMKQCARLAAHDATLATYTTARAVRDALAEAGFAASKAPGCGPKRHMLVARPERAPALKPRSIHGLPPVAAREALVIGAGLAGAATAERLAARGWTVTVIERLAAPASGASGLHAGAFHPHLSIDDCLLSRLARNGFLYSLRSWRALEARGHRVSWAACGVARCARSEAEAAQMARTAAHHGYPASYVELCEREALGLHCGRAVAHGGYWHPQGGWMQPASLVSAQLAQATVHLDADVDRITRVGDAWHAFAADGTLIASAPVVVLANGDAATRLAAVGRTLQRVRGQHTHLPAFAVPGLRSVVAGASYVLPAVDGIVVCGSTYDAGNGSGDHPTRVGHEANLAALKRLLPDCTPPDASGVDGTVGFRAVAPDRMPLIGALPDLAALQADADRLRGARLKDLPRLPGLYGAFGYGSRGLTWAALGGELVASLIAGEPLPLEGGLADAIDPARIALKRMRRRNRTDRAREEEEW